MVLLFHCFHPSADTITALVACVKQSCSDVSSSCFQVGGTKPLLITRENPHEVPLSSTTTVTTHEGVAPDWVAHFNEGEGPHRDLTWTLHLETWLLVKGNQEVLTHEHSTAHIGQAAEILQVSPHKDGAFSLLAEGPVDSQNVDVDCGPVRFMESQCILENRKEEQSCKNRLARLSLCTTKHF